MAHEVGSWKRPNCSLTLAANQLSAREGYSREINETFGEGGALNADYRTVEAVAIVANRLGLHGLVYGKDFVFKTGGVNRISFDFVDESARDRARLHFPGVILATTQ